MKKLLTLFTLLLTVCSGAWADDFVASEITTSGTTHNHVTCTSTAGTSASANVCNDDASSYGSGTASMITASANSNPNTGYIEIKAESGYKLVSPITIHGVVQNNADKAICVVYWEGDYSGTTFSSWENVTFPNRKTVCDNAVTELSFTGTVRTIRLYKQLYINNDGFQSSSGSGKTQGGNTNLGVTQITASATAIVTGDAITLNANGGSANGSGTITANATSFTPTAPTYADHTVDGYYTTSGCATMIATAAGALQPSISVDETAWTDADSKWVKGGDATFYAHWKVNTPEISCSDNTVTITVPTGSSVYYTDDGTTTPTSGSTPYTAPFAITSTKTIKAIAIQDGCTSSEVATEECAYVADVAPTISVTSDPNPASVSKNTTVTLTAEVTGSPDPTVNWYECNSTGGDRSESKGTGLTYSPATDVVGTKYYIAVASNGVSPDAESSVQTVTVVGSSLCKLLEAKYSNGFNSFINEGSKTVTVYYMEGTDAPTVTGTPVVSDGATYDVSDVTKIIVTAEDETTTATYTVTRTAVSPYTTAGELAFDGTETWIKTGNTFDSNEKKWKFSKNDDNWQRETPGQNRIYFFVGPASSIELKTTANVNKGAARSIFVYVNGVKNNDITSQANMGSYLTIPCNENTTNMVEVLSNQTSGDGCFSHIINHTVVPVTVTGAKYATFASDNDLDFSAVTGLSAYTASVANTTVTFNEVTGSVKAGDGLLLYADVDASTTYYVPVATDSPAAVSGNKLVRGTGASLTWVDGETEYYILSKEGNDVGFYKANGNVVSTSKAYLDLTGTNAKAFALPGGETDGIKSVQGSRFTVNGEAYNLAGQRVGKDYKGIVIVNGKKMLNK